MIPSRAKIDSSRSSFPSSARTSSILTVVVPILTPPPLSPGCLSVEKQESNVRETINKMWNPLSVPPCGPSAPYVLLRPPEALIQKPDQTPSGAAQRVRFLSPLIAQLRVWRNEHKRGCLPHLCDGFPPQKMIFPCGAATTGRLSATEMIYCTFKPSHLLFASATHTKRQLFSHPVFFLMVQHGATFIGAYIKRIRPGSYNQVPEHRPR